MIAAGCVEINRLSAFESNNLIGPSVCTTVNPPQAVGVSVLWQIPQFLLVGISEVLASVTAIQFFYTQSPIEMRSVLSAFNLFTGALGTWATAIFILLGNSFQPGQPWIADDANQGKLHYYFFMLAGFMFFNLILFVLVARNYTYKEDMKVLKFDENGQEIEGENDEEQALLSASS
jgi:peptide/histidine transporter 3/4